MTWREEINYGKLSRVTGVSGRAGEENTMAWTWNEIDREWLLGSQIAYTPDEIVKAFEAVEAAFGRQWVEESRQLQGAVERGSAPTLDVAILGMHLGLISTAANTHGLVKKLQNRQPDARAELTAAALTASAGRVVLEFEPAVLTRGRTRRPDFRVGRDPGRWSYVEVTRPNRSEAERQARQVLDDLVSIMTEVAGTYALEIFFWRRPKAGEVATIKGIARALCRKEGQREEPLPDDLGTLYLHHGEVGVFTVEDHGHEYVPRVSQMRVHAEGGKPVRRVAVRMPYFDQRAGQFLATEAGQLPDNSPSLIMIQVSGAPGAIKKWRPLVEGEFGLGIYARVSAVCLFHSGYEPSSHGEAWRPETQLILNREATHALPDWLQTQLRKYEARNS